MISKKELLAELKTHLTQERVERIETVASKRSRKISLVLEDIRQEHNIGALLRTADILGLQDVHLISQRYEARLAKAIAKGSTKWIHLHRYQERDQDNLQICLDALEAKNYQIVVADPNGDMQLSDFKFEGNPIALLMGSEWDGVSPQAMDRAHIKLRIPQYGFTQSYNVSVASALILNHLSQSMRDSEENWRLSEEERIELELEWVMTRLGNSAWPLRDKIEADWLAKNKQ